MEHRKGRSPPLLVGRREVKPDPPGGVGGKDSISHLQRFDAALPAIALVVGAIVLLLYAARDLAATNLALTLERDWRAAADRMRDRAGDADLGVTGTSKAKLVWKDLEAHRRKVLETRADLGLALDGDADRCIIIDEKGHEVDGDQLIGLIAGHWKKAGKLSQAGVVTTIMSNLGLERHLEELGLTLERTKVGDRYVVERMREGGFNLGGEQSGHIVMSDYATTGDGLMAALQVLAVMVEQDKPLSQIAHVFDPIPQKLVNVRYRSTDPLEAESVQEAIAAAEKKLAKKGRLVIRKSGTEPLIRVMAEATDAKLMNSAVESVADAVRAVA